MRSALAIGISLLMLAGSTAPSLAQTSTDKSTTDSKSATETKPSTGRMSNQKSSTGRMAAATPGSENMNGRHSMEGQVTRVDAKKGWLHVKTDEGTMIVHLPPNELQDVKKGDTVTLHLALKDNGPATTK